MKNYLIELDHAICMNFIQDQLEGIGNLINAVVMNNHLQGNFYCIANDNLDPANLYEFTTAVGNGPWPKNEVINFIADYLSSKNILHNLVAEAWGSYVDAPHFNKDSEYFISNDVIFYRLGAERMRADVENVFLKARSAWASGFMPMLVDADLSHTQPYTNIANETRATILQGLTMFFIGLYDGESYLVWVNDGSEHLIKALEQFL